MDDQRPLGDASYRLEELAGELGAALGYWAMRETARDKAAARQAGSIAVDAIDAMLAELHRARQRLVSEIRRSEDAHAAKVDALLADYDGCGLEVHRPVGVLTPTAAIPGERVYLMIRNGAEGGQQ